MNKAISFILLALVLKSAQSQNADAVRAYINKYKDIAIAEMVECKIPASITLAQGIHESNCGQSPLSINANNHFGIKCKEEWGGGKYYHDDDKPQECFRSYGKAESSYKDHSTFLATRPRYAPLFQLSISDYKSWAWGLKSAGYATNPKYAPIIINLIEDYKLYEFDRLALQIVNDSSTLNKTTTQTSITKTDEAALTQKQELNTTKADATRVEPLKSQRQIFLFNNIKTIQSTGIEDPLNLALSLDIDYRLLNEYNDLNEGDKFKDKEYIFLQPKRNKGINATYLVKEGDDMRTVSQKNGIKLSELYNKNLMQPNDQVMPGELIYLQDKREIPPLTISYDVFLKYYALSNPKPDRNSVSNYKEAYASNGSAMPDLLNAPQNMNLDEAILNKDKRYRVGAQDTMYSIARKFGITVEELKNWNQLDGFSLSIGQSLVVNK